MEETNSIHPGSLFLFYLKGDQTTIKSAKGSFAFMPADSINIVPQSLES
jgi:hypothetical protein